FEQLLQLRNKPRIRTALERLYERHGRFEPLVELLRHQLAESEGDTAQRIRGRIAWIQLEGLRDIDAALETALSMLGYEPVRRGRARDARGGRVRAHRTRDEGRGEAACDERRAARGSPARRSAPQGALPGGWALRGSRARAGGRARRCERSGRTSAPAARDHPT